MIQNQSNNGNGAFFGTNNISKSESENTNKVYN